MKLSIVSICTDLATFKERPEIKLNPDMPQERKWIMAWGGVSQVTNNNMSIIVLSHIDGLENLALLPEITMTSFEEIFGYTDENEIVVPAIQAMRDLYDQVYPRTPIVTENGIFTPPLLFAISGDYDPSHLTI